jgi:transposase
MTVIEMSNSSWLVAGMVPGIERHPMKKLDPDPVALLNLVGRWRCEAEGKERRIERVALAFEAGRDGFWLARWLRERGIEAYLMRVFLGWLRGERGHCRMVAIPTLEEEDAKRPSRERESLVGERTRIINRMKGALARMGIRGFKPELRRAPKELIALLTPEGQPLPPNLLEEMRREMTRLSLIREQIAAIEQARLARLQQASPSRPNAMADMLVQEVLSRNLRDRRAVARYAGLTGSPDESGSRRREKGLAKAGNARVRRGLIQLAWRFLMFQKDSGLAQWYRARTAQGARKTTMIVALARKLLIAFWRMVTVGEVPAGVVLRPGM